MGPGKYRNYSLGGTLAQLILIAVVIFGIWFGIPGGILPAAAGGLAFT